MGAKSGPPTYLTPHEERELVNFLIGCAQIGFACTRRQVMSLVRAAMVKKGREDAPITSGWWDSFMRRHPQLTLRVPEKLAYVRVIMGNREVIEAYFNLLKHLLKMELWITRESSLMLMKQVCHWNTNLKRLWPRRE